jgi:4-amino-4-deoxy-L-arabinose transferase-like glycosyltransferase
LDQNRAALGRTAVRLVQLAAITLFVFKFAQLAFAGVFQDEAYYWMWGQHPSLSYFDHPPLNAWLLGLSSAVFGWNVLALRVPVALSFLADILALYLIARRIAGEGWREHFWVTLLLFVATPMFWLVSGLALPDHLLLAMCLMAIAFLVRFFVDRAEGQRGADRDLYLGALFLGLAGLSKYNAAFLALGVGVYVLASHRSVLREPRLWLAAGLTVVLQAPVIIWNATEGFASWEFILHGRHAGLRYSYDGFLGLAFGIVILISPFLFWPIAKFASGRVAIAGTGFVRITFWISSIAILVVSFSTLVLFHWNLVAYAAMLPFLAFVLRPRWLLAGQVLWGAAFAGLAFVNYAIMPLTDVQGWRDEATGWSYGWAPTAAAVRATRADHAVGFIAAPDYTTASLLGFALQDRDVVSLSPNRDEFDYWFDPKAHAGEDAILFDDAWRPMNSAITAQFKTVTPIATLPVMVFGRQIDTHRIYLATEYTPNG